MDNLDDFMRKKFTERDESAPYEFRESYWEAAREVIRADKNKRRRHMVWWWFSSLGILLLIACFILNSEKLTHLFGQSNTDNQQSLSVVLDTKPNKAASISEKLINNSKNEVPQKSLQHTKQREPKQAATNNNAPIEKANFKTENIFSTNSDSDLPKKESSTSIVNQSQGSRLQADSKPIQANRGASSIIEHPTDMPPAASVEYERSPSASEMHSFSEVKTEIVLPKQKSKTNRFEHIFQEKKSERMAKSTDLLPQNMLFLPAFMQVPSITLHVYTKASVKPFTEKTLDWGLQAQGAAYRNATLIQKNIYAYGSGLWVRHIGRNKWGFGSSINFAQYQSNNFSVDSLAASTSINVYDFGFNNEQHTIIPKAVQNIEADVQLIREIKSGYWNVGLWAGKSINIRSESSIENSSSLGATTTNTQKVNSTLSDLPSIYWGLSLGYDHKLSKNLNIGIKARYSPNGFFQSERDASFTSPKVFGTQLNLQYSF